MFVALILLTAAQAVQPAPAAAPQAEQKPAKMECRNITEPGSRIPNRVCKSRDEWDAMAKATQEDYRSSRNQHGEGYNPQ
jgi:hypothetical protein